MQVANLFRAGAMLVVIALASACAEFDGGDSLSPANGIPTFIEHLDASGTKVAALEPAKGWDGSYPIRIVQQDESGRVVSEKVLVRPPTFDLTETLRQMTPAQRDKMQELLEAAAAARPESNAGRALDEMAEIRRRLK